jgi:hypothetical protein
VSGTSKRTGPPLVSTLAIEYTVSLLTDTNFVSGPASADA